mmetsp:Transcript_3380/g.5998  ORF Transcript_3380/g.5998 Transcript_3380/m.5998 type:complete len:233 (-) Transcript_3380:248-946(-)
MASEQKSVLKEDDDGGWITSALYAEQLVRKIIGPSFGADAVNSILERVMERFPSRSSTPQPSAGTPITTNRSTRSNKQQPLLSTVQVDFDFVLSLVVDCYERESDRSVSFLTDLFHRFDVNQDGVMTFNEWQAMVREIDPKRSNREIMQMFKQALEKSEDSDTITPETFVRICREHGFSSTAIKRKQNRKQSIYPSDAAAGGEHQQQRSATPEVVERSLSEQKSVTFIPKHQ